MSAWPRASTRSRRPGSRTAGGARRCGRSSSRFMASWAISASSRSSFMKRLDHHLLELVALSGRHAVEQRLHLADLSPDLLEQLVEALDAGEVLTPLLLERVEVGLVALGALPQHLVEVAHHLAHALEVVGRQVLERLLHALHERLDHLLLQRLHQLVELALRLGVGERVVLELLDPPGGIRRELIEALELLLPLGARRHVALDARALGLEDVVELLLDVLERRAQVVLLERCCWRLRSRSRRFWSPGMRPPCGFCAPRWKRRRSAFQRSPSASRSSDMADRSWSASRSGSAECRPSGNSGRVWRHGPAVDVC